MKITHVMVALAAFSALSACASKPVEPVYVPEVQPITIEPTYTGKYK